VVWREANAKCHLILMLFYVYILRSKKDNSKYIGVTANLKRRLQEHNSGLVKYSSPKRPYILIWYCVFPDKMKAYNFETYLKSSSGHAFMNKHLIEPTFSKYAQFIQILEST
jgi:predicted GIY-YIG superfamily endonuclease